MSTKEWQHLNERLAETAMEHEAQRNYAAAAACWVALADLRNDKMPSPLRERAANCWTLATE